MKPSLWEGREGRKHGGEGRKEGRKEEGRKFVMKITVVLKLPVSSLLPVV